MSKRAKYIVLSIWALFTCYLMFRLTVANGEHTSTELLYRQKCYLLEWIANKHGIDWRDRLDAWSYDIAMKDMLQDKPVRR